MCTGLAQSGIDALPGPPDALPPDALPPDALPPDALPPATLPPTTQHADNKLVRKEATAALKPGDTVRLTARHRDSPICDEQSVTIRLDEADNSITGRLFGPTSQKTVQTNSAKNSTVVTYGRVDHSEDEYVALTSKGANFTTLLLAVATAVLGDDPDAEPPSYAKYHPASLHGRYNLALSINQYCRGIKGSCHYFWVTYEVQKVGQGAFSVL